MVWCMQSSRKITNIKNGQMYRCMQVSNLCTAHKTRKSLHALQPRSTVCHPRYIVIHRTYITQCAKCVCAPCSSPPQLNLYRLAGARIHLIAVLGTISQMIASSVGSKCRVRRRHRRPLYTVGQSPRSRVSGDRIRPGRVDAINL